MFAETHAAQIVTILSWLLAFAWLRMAVVSLRGMSSIQSLTGLNLAGQGLTGSDADPIPSLPVSSSPHLSVIVPACNEEESIQTTLRSLLASTGIVLEIIAVDDRSTDRTGELMERVAAQSDASNPHILRVLHVSELPAGWLGKPHALALGAKHASAPWLLFTDGDVQFHPRALEGALRYALQSQAGHLVLAPTLVLKSAAEGAMLTAMEMLALWVTRLWKVADPHPRDFIGVGAFNMVRREVYEQVGGFEALRMEIVEDLRLGWKIKRAGYVQRFALGPGLVRIRWIKGALSVVDLFEKNGFAIFRYRIDLAFFGFAALAVQIILPLAAFAFGIPAACAGVLIYAGILLTARAVRRMTGVSPWFGLFFAPATAIVLYGFVRSMVLTLARGSVEWRGTRYTLTELRQNAGRDWR